MQHVGQSGGWAGVAYQGPTIDRFYHVVVQKHQCGTCVENRGVPTPLVSRSIERPRRGRHLPEALRAATRRQSQLSDEQYGPFSLVHIGIMYRMRRHAVINEA